MVIKEYTKFVNSLEKEIVNLRRDFHKHAESMWSEFRTTAIIADILEDIGFRVKMGESIHASIRYNLPAVDILEKRLARAQAEGATESQLKKMEGGYTGLIAEIGEGEPIIALRMDIDAMPFAENQEAGYSCFDGGYASIHEDGCHSCGHDAHAAILIGTAKVISHYKDEIRGTIRLIAQPSEEGVAGGISMVEAGAVKGVSSIYGAHTDIGIDAGTIAFTKGGWASSHKFNITLTGQSAHSGSHPQMGNNCILASANIIQNLYALPRHSDGYTRINVGTIKSGTARNSIAPIAFMQAETRAENQQIADELFERAQKIIINSANIYGCNYNIDISGVATTVEFKQEDINLMKNTLSELDCINIEPTYSRSRGGCEDYSFYVRDVHQSGGKAGHIRVGAKPTDKSQNYTAHSSRFDIDEKGMISGVMVLSFLLLNGNSC